MSPSRLRPAGFDAARARASTGKRALRPGGLRRAPGAPSSLRAQAQRAFRAAAERDERLEGEAPRSSFPKGDPRPLTPRPQGGGEQTALGEGEQTPLTQKVRALYEDSVVPVREIARLAGVSERTLYKYVQKARLAAAPCRAAACASAVSTSAAQQRKPRPCVTAKGAGGRFIPTADAGRPVARGLEGARSGRAGAGAGAMPARRGAGGGSGLAHAALARGAERRPRDVDRGGGAARSRRARRCGQACRGAEPKRDVEALRRELARRIEAKVRDWEAEPALAPPAVRAFARRGRAALRAGPPHQRHRRAILCKAGVRLDADVCRGRHARAAHSVCSSPPEGEGARAEAKLERGRVRWFASQQDRPPPRPSLAKGVHARLHRLCRGGNAGNGAARGDLQ